MLKRNSMGNDTTNVYLPFPATTGSLDSDWRGKTATQGVPQIVLLVAVAVHTCAESDVVFADDRVLGRTFMSGPDFVAGGFLLLTVFCDDLAHGLLEVERALLHLGVKLAVDKDTSVKVLLGANAEVFVLRHNSFIHIAD
jgi:hypothetical protein